MKVFYFSLIIFTTLISAIAINYHYINSTSDALTEMLNKLESAGEDEEETQIKNIKEFWESNKIKLSISVSFNEINRMDDLINTLEVNYKTENDQDYELTKALLKVAIEEIRRLERFSIENIF